MKRRIVKADVKRLALCKRGMNGLQTLYKAADGAVFTALCKAGEQFDERGELLFVAAVPGLDFLDGDFYESAEAVRYSAHSFLRNGAALDIEHEGETLPKSDAFVAESFVIQKADPRFADWKNYAGAPVDVTGGWGGVIQIESPALRKSYRAGDWDGVSLFAPAALVEDISESDLERAIRKAIDASLNRETEENDVKIEELNAALASALKPLTDALVKMAPVAVAPVEKDETGPVFSGDISSAEDLAKHEAALRLHALRKSGDLNDPAKVEALRKALETKKVAPVKSDERTALLKRLAELEKSSNQPVGTEKPEVEVASHPLARLTKAEGEISADELMKRARDSAKELNARRYPARKS